MCKLLLVTVFFCSLVILGTLGAPAEEKKDVGAKRRKHQDTFIEVTYGEEKIVLGNIINASLMKDMPKLSWKTENDTLYNIVMLNLDAPTKADPFESDFVHWLVGNIPGNDILKGDTLVEYIGAFPIKDAGTQNFMFILNEQPQGHIDYKWDLITKS